MYEESETALGLGLYALGPPVRTGDFSIGSKSDFDRAFERTLEIIRPSFRGTPSVGTYGGKFDDLIYHYAYWCFPETYVTLVQHFEGDGHCGHEASLDLRIIPRLGSDNLAFPLRTNILF
ncbi:MAG: hypothetical protein RBS80_31280 [Thermoguttaceae bacterium]|nr:hypothetical protein [Thermoguttaceae bacterium]